MGSRVKNPLRHAAVTIALVLFSTTTACAQPAPQAQPSLSDTTITLTNSDCTAKGLGAVLQSQFVAAVDNKTLSKAQFNLHRLIDGREYRELELHIQARQQAAGSNRPVLPPMTVHAIGSGFIEAGQRGKLEGTLTSGTYGLICRRDSPGGTEEAIYVIGPFRVG